MTPDIVFVYVTVPSQEVAAEIAQAVVTARLAACANILPAMTSVYRWQGKVEKAEEAVLILKTPRELFAALCDKVATLHPYDVPCIAALPLVAGHAPYLEWVAAETATV